MKDNKIEVINHNPNGTLLYHYPLEVCHCPTVFRKQSQLSEIDIILLNILKSYQEEVIEYTDFGLLLGFAIKENWQEGFYKDLAEIEIYDTLLEKLLEYNLIAKQSTVINLTEDGVLALQTNSKYKYYSQSLPCYQDLIPYKTATDFDFKVDFDLPDHIYPNREISLRQWIEIRSKIDPINEYWYERIITHYQNSTDIEILKVSDPIHFELRKLQTEYTFIKDEKEQYFVSVDTEKGFSECLSQVINHQDNDEFKYEIIFEYRFNKLWNDLNSVFNTDLIQEFASKWDWETLIQDKRLAWSSDFLELLTLQNNGLWLAVSRHIPTDLLERNISLFISNWEWNIITERLSDNFIDLHFETYISYWDTSVLLNRNLAFLQVLIQKSIAFSKAWDLTDLTSQFSDEFLLETFNPINRYNYVVLSKKTPSWVIELISRENKRFSENQLSVSLLQLDWTWITEVWDLDLILKNLDILHSFLDWKVLLSRIIINTSEYRWLLYDDNFVAFLDKNSTRTNSFSDENIPWTEDLLTRLDELQLLIWSSTYNRKGIDTNEAIIWTLPFLSKFSHRFTSLKGQTYISNYIDNFDYIRQLPNFPWDWHAISSNYKLIWTPDTLEEFKAKVFWTIISEKLPESFINRYFQKFGEYWDADIFSKKLSFIFIDEHLESFNWDFSILTKRDEDTVCTLIIKDRIAVNQWDWSWISEAYSIVNIKKIISLFARSEEYLHVNLVWRNFTRRLDWSFIISCFLDKWDWSYLIAESNLQMLLSSRHNPISNYFNWKKLTERLVKEGGIEDILGQGEDRLDWTFLIGKYFTLDYLLVNRQQTSDWINQIQNEEQRTNIRHIFTKRLSLQQKRELMDEDEKLRVLDWVHLSRLTEFTWNINFIDRYKDQWNWQEGLSKNPKVNWDWNYLYRYQENWDWAFLSEFSQFISDKEPQKPINRFKNKINFFSLSRRSNINLGNEILIAYLEKWDYTALSVNKRLSISPQFLKEHHERPWDWQALSVNPNLQLVNETLLELKDKNWDWFTLTKQPKLDFTFDFIQQTSDKSWDWQIISHKLNDAKDFIPIVNLIKDKGLDWTHLSKQRFINFSECLSQFERYWNFELLSSNPAFRPTVESIAKYSERWDYKSLTRLTWENTDTKMKYVSDNSNQDWDYDFLLKDNSHKKTTQWLFSVANFLDWDEATSEFIKFSDEEIKYGLEILKWHLDWNKITDDEENYNFKKKYDNIIKKILEEEPGIRFIKSLNQQDSEWKGYVYHYAHLENVAKILNSSEILSRNLASHQDQAAQQIVNRRKDPHNYARFYFRPKTPYQYYTEGLGIPFGQEVYNEYANRGVEYPKCPVPFLIKIPLKELLSKPPTELRITNGNFHADMTQAFLLEDAVDIFDYDNVYSHFPDYHHFWLGPNMGFDYHGFISAITKYKRGSQQELVVSEKCQISGFQRVEILCIDSNHKNTLLELLDSHDKWENKIKVNNSYFNLNNSFVNYNWIDDELYIYRDSKEIKRKDWVGNNHSEFYHAKGKIHLEANGIELIEGDILKHTSNFVEAHTTLRVRLKGNPYKIYFTDDKTKWLIYAS